MPKFTLDIDDISEQIDKLNCQADNLDEKIDTENELTLFENKNNTINNKCENYTNIINDNGSSGTIYEYDGKYIKFSNLPLEVSKLFSKYDIKCNTLKMKINKAINENVNALKFAELAKVFPLQIMNIYSSSECKNDNGLFSNIMLIEKVEGITLGEFLTKINLNNENDLYDLISCLLQLIYITTYANFNGFVHNDLTISNIMIYYSNQKIVLNKLKINKNLININLNKSFNTPIVKLIDFSYSTYIEPNKIYNKIIFGETIQIVKIIRNKLKLLHKHCHILEIIDAFLDKCIENTNFYDFIAELDVDIYSSNGYRLLSNNKIIELTFDHSIKECILNFYNDLSKILHEKFNNFFNINISNLIHYNDENVNIINKKQEISNIDDKYHIKYLKYKNKYLNLKKKIFTH